jgi:hypothetical protein
LKHTRPAGCRLARRSEGLFAQINAKVGAHVLKEFTVHAPLGVFRVVQRLDTLPTAVFRFTVCEFEGMKCLVSVSGRYPEMLRLERVAVQ